MLKNRISYVMLFLSLTMLYIYTNSYYALLLGIAAVAVPLLALLLLLGSYRRVTLQMKVMTTESREPEIVYFAQNESIFPVLVLSWIVDLYHHPSGDSSRQRLQCSVAGKALESVHLKFKNSKTGKLVIITNRLRAYDFLGLFGLPLPSLDETEILIYPQIFDIQVRMDNLIEVYGDSMSYSQSKAGNDVNEIFALHEYMEGDDLRKVHWKLSSKTDLLMVRDFSLPLNHPISLLLELVKGNGPHEAAKLATCLDTFVSLSVSLIQRGFSHNIAWFDVEEEFLHLHEVANMTDLQLYLPAILASSAYHDKQTALQYYSQSQYAAVPVLYYVTTFYGSPLLAEISAKQILRILLVSDEEMADAHNLAAETRIVAVSTENTANMELII